MTQNRPETVTQLAPGLRTDPSEGDRLRTGLQARKIASTRIHVHNPVDDHFDDAYWAVCDEAHATTSYRFPGWWIRSGRTIEERAS